MKLESPSLNDGERHRTEGKVEEFWEFWESMGEIVIPIGLMSKIEAEKNRI